MSEWLLVRLDDSAPDGDAAAPVAWMVVDGAGHLVAPPAMSALESLAGMVGNRRVAIIVPGADVVALDVDLPPRASGARLLQAVPFAIEEQVADDIDTLHVALGARDPSGRTRVSVVNRTLLDGWLQRLSQAGIQPHAMFADSALLPDAGGQAVALLEGDEICLRAADRPAVRLPRSPFAEAMELVFEPGSEWPALTLFADAAVWADASAEVEALRDRFAGFRVQLLPNGALPLLAARAVGVAAGESAPTNLLQGAYATQHGGTVDWKPWRLAAGLAAAWLLLFMGAQAWQYRELRKSEQALDAAIAEIARTTLPGEPAPADPRGRIEQQLLAVRSGGAESGPWLPALLALAQARGASPDAQFESLGVEQGGIDVRIKADSAESLERINAALRASGWQAELQGGSASASAYEGRIRLRAAGQT